MAEEGIVMVRSLVSSARRRAVAGVVFAVALSAGPAAHARTWTWTGNGTDDKWSNTNNWIPVNGYPTNNISNAHDLIFDGSARLTPDQDLADVYYAHSLVFSNNAGAYQLGGTNYLAGYPGLRGYNLARSNPYITVLGTSDILIMGLVDARNDDLNQVITVPSNVVLQVPWIRGGSGEKIVKNGGGTLRVYEHADGQRYWGAGGTMGPRYQVNDGTVEFGTRANRYVWNDTSGTNWAASSNQTKASHSLVVGDGVGAETSAVVRLVDGGNVLNNNNFYVDTDGLLDFNGKWAPDLSENYAVLSNKSALVRIGSAVMTFDASAKVYLDGSARIEGNGSAITMHNGAVIRVDNTETRAVIACDTRQNGNTNVGPTFIVADKPDDDVDFEWVGTLGAGGNNSLRCRFVKQGLGTMAIAGASLYGAGSTQTVAEGALLINGGVVQSTTPAVWQVLTNATLGGSGTISNAAVFVFDGILAPGVAGNRVGQLTLWSNLVLSGACTLRVDVTGSAAVAGVDYDQLKVGRGQVTGLSNVDLVLAVTNKPNIDNQTLRVISGGGDYRGQTFHSLAITGLPGATATPTYGNGFVDVTVRSVSGTALLLW
jgi:hypothetical protein